jgi:hypothetical protein
MRQEATMTKTIAMLLWTMTAGAEGFHYTGPGELKLTSGGEAIASIPVSASQDSASKKRCHAKECAAKGRARDAEDAARGKRSMTHTHDGMYVRSLVAKADQEVDCREFPVENCFADAERKGGFSYDYVRTEKDGRIYWSVENVKGVELKAPHRFSKAKNDPRDNWTFEGKDPFKAHCAISRLNGWQQMMEERGGDKITISLLEYVTQE